MNEFGAALGYAAINAGTLLLWAAARWLRSKVASARELTTSAKIHDTKESGLRIMVLLAELGTKMGADRAFLSQFHNGDHYVSGSELMRKSRTHEWDGPNVKCVAAEHQNILASLVHDECELIEEPGASYRLTADLPHGSFRRGLESRGVASIARAAVHKNGDVIGFIGVDFLDPMDSPPSNISELPIYALRIERSLRQGNA